jgi:hypothetical protein
LLDSYGVEVGQYALRRLDSFDGNAALGGEIELHLVQMFESPVDVAQMLARLALESAEVPANRGEITPALPWIESAIGECGLCRVLRFAHRAIRDVKCADALD